MMDKEAMLASLIEMKNVMVRRKAQSLIASSQTLYVCIKTRVAMVLKPGKAVEGSSRK